MQRVNGRIGFLILDGLCHKIRGAEDAIILDMDEIRDERLPQQGEDLRDHRERQGHRVQIEGLDFLMVKNGLGDFGDFLRQERQFDFDPLRTDCLHFFI